MKGTGLLKSEARLSVDHDGSALVD